MKYPQWFLKAIQVIPNFKIKGLPMRDKILHFILSFVFIVLLLLLNINSYVIIFITVLLILLKEMIDISKKGYIEPVEQLMDIIAGILPLIILL